MNTAAQATSNTGPFAAVLLGLRAGAAAPAPVRPADLEPYRPMLTKYARRWLRSEADVEDAVQDTLIAALQSPESFAGRSTPKTWLHGILKHKIIDIYRRQAREPVREAQPEDDLQDEVNAMFAADGHWRDAPADWGDPEAALAQRQFQQVFESCLDALPGNCGRAFKLRELMGLEVGEICDVLGVGPDNCYLMLHRARLRLRALLEQRWFAAKAPASCA
jgi:RNA polymerase sigma-70 factor (TIGR02943 family)